MMIDTIKVYILIPVEQTVSHRRKVTKMLELVRSYCCKMVGIIRFFVVVVVVFFLQWLFM